MAKLEQFKLSVSERRRRTFSENFKKQKVQEIERGISKVSEICRQYEVSDVSVYNWINKFGAMKEKNERLIVETESDTLQLLELKRRWPNWNKSLVKSKF